MRGLIFLILMFRLSKNKEGLNGSLFWGSFFMSYYSFYDGLFRCGVHTPRHYILAIPFRTPCGQTGEGDLTPVYNDKTMNPINSSKVRSSSSKT